MSFEIDQPITLNKVVADAIDGFFDLKNGWLRVRFTLTADGLDMGEKTLIIGGDDFKDFMATFFGDPKDSGSNYSKIKQWLYTTAQKEGVIPGGTDKE